MMAAVAGFSQASPTEQAVEDFDLNRSVSASTISALGDSQIEAEAAHSSKSAKSEAKSAQSTTSDGSQQASGPPSGSSDQTDSEDGGTTGQQATASSDNKKAGSGRRLPKPLLTQQEATLRCNGEQPTLGSTGHPDECKPCAFYCFSLRGCTRGPECTYCHMYHESKLRQRREEWKRHQRMKHGKAGHQACDTPVHSIERAASTLTELSERESSQRHEQYQMCLSKISSWADAMQDENMHGTEGGLSTAQEEMLESTNVLTADSSSHRFAYNLQSCILALGQEVELAPVGLPNWGTHVKLTIRPALPCGLQMDAATGVIKGAAMKETPGADAVVYTVTARFTCTSNSTWDAMAELCLKVIDLCSNDFAVSHLSEVADGRYMILFTKLGEDPQDVMPFHGVAPLVPAMGLVAMPSASFHFPKESDPP